MADFSPTRRALLGAVGAALAGGRVGAARPVNQARGGSPAPTAAGASAQAHLAPRPELVNSLEFEAQARLALPRAAFDLLADDDRAAFDRLTLHPRMMVPTTDLDLTLSLLGQSHFTPIIVGPVERQIRFHPDAEGATVRGASAARAAVVIPQRSSLPLERVTADLTTPWWAQAFVGDADAGSFLARAASAGCHAACITVGVRTVAARTARATTDWRAVDRVRRGLEIPVLIKGITTPDGAREALRHDVQGLIVSNYGRLPTGGADALILELPAILEAVGGRVPVLIDGGFRRGTDILKALALGAKAVLVGRPAMWGLAAYGADGVQTVIEMLQTELARYMCMCGRTSLAQLDPGVVRVHARAPAGSTAHG